VTNISKSFYLQDGDKNQLEQNYVTVALCVTTTEPIKMPLCCMDSGGPKEPCSLRGRILPGEGAIFGVAGFLKSIVGNSELQTTECGLTLNYFDHLLCTRFVFC